MAEYGRYLGLLFKHAVVPTGRLFSHIRIDLSVVGAGVVLVWLISPRGSTVRDVATASLWVFLGSVALIVVVFAVNLLLAPPRVHFALKQRLRDQEQEVKAEIDQLEIDLDIARKLADTRTAAAVELYDLTLHKVDCQLIVSSDGRRGRIALTLGNSSGAKLRWWVRSLRAGLGAATIQYSGPTVTKWDGVIGRGGTQSFKVPDIPGVTEEPPHGGWVDICIDYGDVDHPPRYRNEKRIAFDVLRSEAEGFSGIVDLTVVADEHTELY